MGVVCVTLYEERNTQLITARLSLCLQYTLCRVMRKPALMTKIYFFSVLHTSCTSDCPEQMLNKRAHRALCHSPEKKVKGYSGAIDRGPLM